MPHWPIPRLSPIVIMSINEQTAPPTLRITDTATGTVTEHETYSIGVDAIGRYWIHVGSGGSIGPFADSMDAFDYLIAMDRSV